VRAALLSAGVPYAVHRHADHPVPIDSPETFARVLGIDAARIARTLLVQARGTGRQGLVVCAAGRRMDAEAVGRWLGGARAELAPREALARRLGQPPRGVSPVGAGELPVCLDAGLTAHPTVLVGSGVAGVEVEIDPENLRRVCGAEVLPVTLGFTMETVSA
jgi:Cys-tRNA(Pro)/Cys-tRNA(Cys) deacylase